MVLFFSFFLPLVPTLFSTFPTESTFTINIFFTAPPSPAANVTPDPEYSPTVPNPTNPQLPRTNHRLDSLLWHIIPPISLQPPPPETYPAADISPPTPFCRRPLSPTTLDFSLPHRSHKARQYHYIQLPLINFFFYLYSLKRLPFQKCSVNVQ